jgi:hypothetical protein
MNNAKDFILAGLNINQYQIEILEKIRSIKEFDNLSLVVGDPNVATLIPGIAQKIKVGDMLRHGKDQMSRITLKGEVTNENYTPGRIDDLLIANGLGGKYGHLTLSDNVIRVEFDALENDASANKGKVMMARRHESGYFYNNFELSANHVLVLYLAKPFKLVNYEK